MTYKDIKEKFEKVYARSIGHYVTFNQDASISIFKAGELGFVNKRVFNRWRESIGMAHI